MAAEHTDRTLTEASGLRPKGEPAEIREDLGYGARLEETLPPTPLKNILEAGGVHVCVLSSDDALVHTVERAGGALYPVVRVTEWPELVAAIEQGRCDIAWIDAASLGDRLQKRIGELAKFSGRLVTLVAADRAGAQNLIGLLSERKIHRLLIKPPALGITRLLLESAVVRFVYLRDHAAPGTPLAPASTNPAARVPPWILATGIAALLIAVGVVAGLPALRGRTTEAPAAENSPAAGAAAESPAPADRFADLLARAERAFNEGRLATPPGDNALDYYVTILAADPAQPAARERLGIVVDALFTQAEGALLANSLDTASGVLDAVRRADPSSGRLAFLDAQLALARAAAASAAAGASSAAAAAAAAAAAPTELEGLLAVAGARLARGQLLTPAGDSAREYLDRATRLDATNHAVLQARAALAEALTAAGRTSLAGGDIDAAARQIEAARSYGADARTLAPLQRSIAEADRSRAATRNTESLAVARERIREGRLLEPAEDAPLLRLAAIQKAAADTPGLDEAWTELVQALAATANTALASGDWASADKHVAALRQTGRADTIAATLSHDVTRGRLQQEYLATPVAASELRLANSVPAVYPPEALRSQTEGWVDLEYVVDRNGQTRDIMVLQAEPRRRFEPAAINAVSQYRYEPFQRDGDVYERRVRARVRFTLQ